MTRRSAGEGRSGAGPTVTGRRARGDGVVRLPDRSPALEECHRAQTKTGELGGGGGWGGGGLLVLALLDRHLPTLRSKGL